MAETPTVKTDKLLEIFPIKVPSCLKHHLGRLSPSETKIMLDEVRIVMARHVLNSSTNFDPSLYLSTESANETGAYMKTKKFNPWLSLTIIAAVNIFGWAVIILAFRWVIFG